MFDDEAILEAENVETDLWPTQHVTRVREDKVPILKNAYRVDSGRAHWERFEEGTESRNAICDAKIVLNVFSGIYYGSRTGISSFNGLHEVVHLLFEVSVAAGRRGPLSVRESAIHCNADTTFNFLRKIN